MHQIYLDKYINIMNGFDPCSHRRVNERIICSRCTHTHFKHFLPDKCTCIYNLVIIFQCKLLIFSKN